MAITVSISIESRADAQLIAPKGLSTPTTRCSGVRVTGGHTAEETCVNSGQTVLVITPEADQIGLTYEFAPGGPAYPDQMFKEWDSRYTRVGAALADEARSIVSKGGLPALVAHVAHIFDYGHVETTFYEGQDEIPQLCDMTTGSCVDINTYLIAAARAPGIEAGYVTGYFIPDEKRTWTSDMHCWVVTRVEGVTQEWDIAHHLKMGRREIEPGLNPKPGVRVAMTHSMGWHFPALGLADVKLIAEPIWRGSDGWHRAAERFEFAGYELLAAA